MDNKNNNFEIKPYLKKNWKNIFAFSLFLLLVTGFLFINNTNSDNQESSIFKSFFNIINLNNFTKKTPDFKNNYNTSPNQNLSPSSASMPSSSANSNDATKTSIKTATLDDYFKFIDELKNKNLETKILKLSEHIGHLTSDIPGLTPEIVDQSIYEISQSLTAKDQDYLKNNALDFQKPQDERFMSAYMLSKSPNTPNGTEALKNILTTPTPEHALDKNKPIDFELALRAYAAESLGQSPTNQAGARNGGLQALKDSLNKISHPFLLDRAQRAIYISTHPNSNSPEDKNSSSIEKQDKKALEQLLSRQ